MGHTEAGTRLHLTTGWSLPAPSLGGEHEASEGVSHPSTVDTLGQMLVSCLVYLGMFSIITGLSPRVATGTSHPQVWQLDCLQTLTDAFWEQNWPWLRSADLVRWKLRVQHMKRESMGYLVLDAFMYHLWEIHETLMLVIWKRQHYFPINSHWGHPRLTATHYVSWMEVLSVYAKISTWDLEISVPHSPLFLFIFVFLSPSFHQLTLKSYNMYLTMLQGKYNIWLNDVINLTRTLRWRGVSHRIHSLY